MLVFDEYLQRLLDGVLEIFLILNAITTVERLATEGVLNPHNNEN